ncbi:hypothetical protein LHYA1_G004833 [Lachnellula hyalina]|uniref:Uncharacterized protein n=1 Tax=Lachnellula hyalina TaxID=1316788 RepID=A0A8H8R1V5_9HELO|nr:uncharacterized protein LHYA1_G004833 [Lachnellula hyalina]TVY26913.1 hypothetical protein LHYA1_G004833 [Lachnellula hyalina]
MAANNIEPDDFDFDDEGADFGSAESSTASISSSLVQGVDEYGRRYASYGKAGKSTSVAHARIYIYSWQRLIFGRVWHAD